MKYTEFKFYSKVSGTKVHYRDPHTGKVENGIVQTFVPVVDGVGQLIYNNITEVYVVYKCAGQWDKYQDYTAVRTELKDLELGWKKKLSFKAKNS